MCSHISVWIDKYLILLFQRGGQVDKDKLKALETQDEELARVIQEQEKLRMEARKRKHRDKKEMRRCQSEIIADYKRSDMDPRRSEIPPAVAMGFPPQQIRRQTSQPPPFRQVELVLLLWCIHSVNLLSTFSRKSKTNASEFLKMLSVTHKDIVQ